MGGAERRKVQEGCERDIERINNDIRTIQYDLKRLPKEKEPQFSDKVASLKKKVNKLEKRIKGGEQSNISNEEDISERLKNETQESNRKKKAPIEIT